MAFAGAFTPVLAKHSKSFSLIDCISVGVDRMQRNFEPMRKQVEACQRSELTDVTAKVVLECVYFGIQGTGTHSSIQGDGETGENSGRAVLTIVVVHGAVWPAPLVLTSPVVK
jgi:hypothetical protein